MAKNIGYPRASLKNAIDVANAVYELGGHSTIHTCADKMGKKVSGAFQALVSAADKYGLINNQRGELSSTDLFNEYKHAYSEEEEATLLRRAFLSSDVFSTLYTRFKGRVVPAEILDRILIREFEVPPPMATRISGYFINGAKQTALIDSDNKLVELEIEVSTDEVLVEDDQNLESSSEHVASIFSDLQANNPESYSVLFRGPGLNTTIQILEDDDLIIVEAIISKIKKKMGVK